MSYTTTMNKNTIEQKLNTVIEEKINPVLGEHLGGLILVHCDNRSATVKFTGNCRTCYAAEETLENVVKDIIFRELPEIEEINLDESVSEDILNFARKLLSKEK